MQMETNFAYIDENYKRIVDAMEEAKAKYRKPTDEITLMAVTKTVAPEIMRSAVVSTPWVKTACRNIFLKKIFMQKMQKFILLDIYKPIK